MITSEEELLRNYYATTTCYYYGFISHITGSVYNVVLVVVKYHHVVENMTHHVPIYPLMITDYYYKITFCLREHRKKTRSSCVVVIFRDFYFTYVMGQKNVVVKCSSFSKPCSSFSKPGGVFN
jgi:hypothetical protein